MHNNNIIISIIFIPISAAMAILLLAANVAVWIVLAPFVFIVQLSNAREEQAAEVERLRRAYEARDRRVFDHDNYTTSTEIPAFKVQSGFDAPGKKEKVKRAKSTFSVAAVRASKPARKEVSRQQIEHKSTFNIAAVRASKVA